MLKCAIFMPKKVAATLLLLHVREEEKKKIRVSCSFIQNINHLIGFKCIIFLQ